MALSRHRRLRLDLPRRCGERGLLLWGVAWPPTCRRTAAGAESPAAEAVVPAGERVRVEERGHLIATDVPPGPDHDMSYRVVFLGFPLEEYGAAADQGTLAGRVNTYFGG